MKITLDEDFVGVRRTVTDPHTVEYSCRGVIKSMSELIKPYPLAPGVTDAWPMSPNATRELRAGPSEKNPLVPLLIPIARQICGTIGFIVSHVRPDAYFAFCVLAKYMGTSSPSAPSRICSSSRGTSCELRTSPSSFTRPRRRASCGVGQGSAQRGWTPRTATLTKG